VGGWRCAPVVGRTPRHRRRSQHRPRERGQSAWEIATKHRLGKLGTAGPLLDRLLDYLADQGFVELGVSIRHGHRAGALPGPHRDPFDRMLLAQAQVEGLALVSNEAAFDRYGVERLW